MSPPSTPATSSARSRACAPKLFPATAGSSTTSCSRAANVRCTCATRPLPAPPRRLRSRASSRKRLWPPCEHDLVVRARVDVVFELAAAVREVHVAGVEAGEAGERQGDLGKQRVLVGRVGP